MRHPIQPLFPGLVTLVTQFHPAFYMKHRAVQRGPTMRHTVSSEPPTTDVLRSHGGRR